ncbi:ATP-binding cassette domain-containing protein [Campylobacter coli]|nr:sugar ABC transporter ATP-binding protein [Campylobacter coli]EHR1928970.1 sugar ABC transporter ATP-binding protein [Campylobacter coli]EHZ5036377.1 sugar ABC transporter ATP-binding protein [Campylobacter coli]EIX1387981.1 sugar ABC transporter ATP-binding protein [Campylobacter coli]EJW9881671.1 sugar ABC transporter ATP-binding protein [Campylobacter coli]
MHHFWRVIQHNVSVSSLNKYLIGGIMLDDKKIEQLVQENVAKLSIKTPSSKTLIQSLSGGNQQKVLISRWLANDPDVFILDEPTRGIDVGAKYEIYCIIAELAKQGKRLNDAPFLAGHSTLELLVRIEKISLAARFLLLPSSRRSDP